MDAREHFIVAADAGHLRFLAERRPVGQATPTLEPVLAMDFPAGRAWYTDAEADQAGRFPAAQHSVVGGPGRGVQRTGASIDERLPLQREQSRRRARDLAGQISDFLAEHPGASWDFAAAPDLNGAVLDQLDRGVRARLRRSVAKDLVRQPLEHVRSHFEAAGASGR